MRGGTVGGGNREGPAWVPDRSLRKAWEARGPGRHSGALPPLPQPPSSALLLSAAVSIQAPSPSAAPVGGCPNQGTARAALRPLAWI